MVLHDIGMNPGGVDEQPIARLDQFIQQAKDNGYEIVQEYSPDAVLISRGKITQPLDHLTTTARSIERPTTNPLFVKKLGA